MAVHTMGNLVNIVTQLHTRTRRDYLSRMLDEKVECMRVAKRYGWEYWDGPRRYGYGGYKYDGRWERVARKLVERYALHDDARILDVGCGKGYLLYEFARILPGARTLGFDASRYALENAKEEIRPFLFEHRAESPYPFADKEFDLVVCVTTLHNLQLFDLRDALGEIERVGKQKLVVVESFRSDAELFNLQCWALTCEVFLTPEAWVWFFGESGYTGDYEFIFFE
jgi:SAM-dependent methyltransferase